MKNLKFPSGKTLKYYHSQFRKMKHEKSHYQTLHCEGYIWESYSKGVHTFHRTLSDHPMPFTPNDQWIECTDEMLSNGDFLFMVENNLTLDDPYAAEANWLSGNNEEEEEI